jgi:hypothetical protein
MHRLGEAEYPGQHATDRRKGHLRHQSLIPVLQQVRVLPLRQPETFIQWNRLDLLALACPIDRPH